MRIKCRRYTEAVVATARRSHGVAILELHYQGNRLGVEDKLILAQLAYWRSLALVAPG